MYHNYISRKYNEETNIKINDDEKIKIIDIINKMITQEEKYEFYYIYKDTFKKLYEDIIDIDNNFNLEPIIINNVVLDEDYSLVNKKNKKIIDIMKK